MASHLWSKVEALDKSVKLLPGRFAPAGTGAVTGVVGTGFTVARTGVGTYRITLSDKYPKILAVTHGLHFNTPTALATQLKALDTTNQTFDLVVINTSTGAATEVAADANNQVHFVLWLSNSSYVPV